MRTPFNPSLSLSSPDSTRSERGGSGGGFLPDAGRAGKGGRRRARRSEKGLGAEEAGRRPPAQQLDGAGAGAGFQTVGALFSLSSRSNVPHASHVWKQSGGSLN